MKRVLLLALLAACDLDKEWRMDCPPSLDRAVLVQRILDCVNAGASGKQTLSGHDQDMDDVVIWCGNTMEEALGCKSRLLVIPTPVSP